MIWLFTKEFLYKETHKLIQAKKLYWVFYNRLDLPLVSIYFYLTPFNNHKKQVYHTTIFLFFLIPSFSQFQSNHILDLSSPEENIWRR